MMGKLIDLTGQRFGRLTVLSRASNDKHGNTQWLCKCECGKLVVRHAHNLKKGRPADCGCGLTERMRNIALKHGGKNSRLYSIWIDMIRRCETPARPEFARYGGRGIVVFQPWHDFSVFQNWAVNNGYSDNLTIDRVDNDGDYTPENCRWTSMKMQTNNKRNNTRICYDGEEHTLSEWAEIMGINRATISSRILRFGWPIERALTEPVHKKNT